jgi:hypothetical protein
MIVQAVWMFKVEGWWWLHPCHNNAPPPHTLLRVVVVLPFTYTIGLVVKCVVAFQYTSHA